MSRFDFMKRSANLVLDLATASRNLSGWFTTEIPTANEHATTTLVVASCNASAELQRVCDPILRAAAASRKETTAHIGASAESNTATDAGLNAGTSTICIEHELPDLPGKKFWACRTSLPNSLYLTFVGYGELDGPAVEHITTTTAKVASAAILQYYEITEALEQMSTMRAQALEQATFLARTEHRLKTPLTVVMGWTHVLDEWSKLDTERRNAIKGIMLGSLESVRCDLESLIDDARTKILIAEGDLATFSLSTFLDNMQHRFAAITTQHDVVFHFAPELEVFSNEALLQEILDEFIGNAVKYSPDGGRIDVHARNVDGYAEIEVHDEGIGLPDGMDIFAAFERGSTARSTSSGTGLGLYLVHEIAKTIDATITAENRNPKGSTFRIRLPRDGQSLSKVAQKYAKREERWRLHRSEDASEDAAE